MKKIILGSSSPRRKELLANYIPIFQVAKPMIVEEKKIGESPIAFSQRMAIEKGLNILQANEEENNLLIISSDTIVTIDQKILGKPNSFEQAKEFLQMLSGKSHKVISSLCLIEKQKRTKILVDYDTTIVYFKEVNDEIIEEYLNKTVYQDKAGAYAIQTNSELIIQKIEGSKNNVIGFPSELFLEMSKDCNLDLQK